MTLLFGDRLAQACRERHSVTVVGIDPTPDCLPPALAAAFADGGKSGAQAMALFSLGLVRATADLAAAVKVNIAFFEAYGLYGLTAFKAVLQVAKKMGVLCITDAKRGDIGSTAAAYARGLLAGFNHDPLATPADISHAHLGPTDAVTLNPYLGSDSLQPFFKEGLPRGQGFFVLVKTSNPSAVEVQDLALAEGGTVAEAVARKVDTWGRDSIGASGLSAVGAVVGATRPDELARFRELMPHAPLLLPGYGAQGGTAEGLAPAFREDGTGAVVNASRSVMTAWKKEDKPEDWAGAARRAVLAMNEDLRAALERAGRWIGG